MPTQGGRQGTGRDQSRIWDRRGGTADEPRVLVRVAGGCRAHCRGVRRENATGRDDRPVAPPASVRGAYPTTSGAAPVRPAVSADVEVGTDSGHGGLAIVGRRSECLVTDSGSDRGRSRPSGCRSRSHGKRASRSCRGCRPIERTPGATPTGLGVGMGKPAGWFLVLGRVGRTHPAER